MAVDVLYSRCRAGRERILNNAPNDIIPQGVVASANLPVALTQLEDLFATQRNIVAAAQEKNTQLATDLLFVLGFCACALVTNIDHVIRSGIEKKGEALVEMLARDSLSGSLRVATPGYE